MTKVIVPHSLIPVDEIRLSFARSSGAGGQNINKTSTKAVLHWSVGDSQVFSFVDKKQIREKLANRINNDDEVVIMAEQERSQLQNKLWAIDHLNELVAEALIIPKKRRPTRPTYASKLKRLESKKIRSRIKESRRGLE